MAGLGEYRHRGGAGLRVARDARIDLQVTAGPELSGRG